MKKTAYVLFLLVLLSASWVLADEGSEKMDKILQNQSLILAKLDEIKSELGVVKVRATER